METISVYIVADEHTNLDSLPLRYGFQYPQNTVLELSNIANKASAKDNCIGLDADFQRPNGEIERGHFVLMDKGFKNLKVVTVWRNDSETEFNLSELMKSLRKEGNLKVKDLLDLHPHYADGTLTTFSTLFNALVKRGVIKASADEVASLEAEMELKFKDKYEKEIIKRDKDIETKDTTIFEQKTQLNEQNTELNEQKTRLKMKDAEIAAYQKNQQQAAANKIPSTSTLSEETTLSEVNRDVYHKSSDCTELVFSNGSKKYMKTAMFDKDLRVTEKAESLVGKVVKTTCWDPVSEPGKWSNQGYFGGIYEMDGVAHAGDGKSVSNSEQASNNDYVIISAREAEGASLHSSWQKGNTVIKTDRGEFLDFSYQAAYWNGRKGETVKASPKPAKPDDSGWFHFYGDKS